jgi:PAS domain S-box-containing protein
MADRTCYTVNHQGYLTWIAKNVFELSGYTQAEAVGRHFFEFIDSEHHEEILRKRENRSPGRIDEYYTRLIKKDGTKLPVRIKVLQTPENTVGYIDRRLSDRKP